MVVIPSIDLQQGQCVRLRQGQFDDLSIYDIQPQALALKYAAQGAKCLHIVDLDGAKKGLPQHLNSLKEMQSCGLAIQAGGGIRRALDASALMKAGVKKIVLGSIAITDPTRALKIIEQIGADNTILALDVNIDGGIPKPAIHGWQTKTEQSLWDVVPFYQTAGIHTILCTDIAMDGMLNGPNFSLYEEAISRFQTLNWQASGGVRNPEDLQKLASIGVHAAIIGRALYESGIALSDWFLGEHSC